MNDSTPCTRWADKLTIRHPEDLSLSERKALDEHIAGCTHCAATRERYRLMATRVRALPAVKPLPELTPQFLQSREDMAAYDEQIDLVPSSALPSPKYAAE